MALALAVVDVDVTRRKRRIKYKVTPTGNYPTNGDVIDFTLATNLNFLPQPGPSFPPTVDQLLFSDSLAGALPEFVAGTTLANAKIKLWSSAGNEHANGAYTAGELADVFYFTLEIPLHK